MRTFIILLTIVLSTHISVAHPSYGLAMDSKGNLYFADISKNGRGTVWSLSSKGELRTLFKDFHAHSLTVDKDDNLYVAHGEDTHLMLKLTPGGKIDTLIQTEDYNHFFGGNCAVTPDGSVVFGINKRIYKWREEGREVVSELKLDWNSMLYADGLGNLYVNDLEKNDGTLYEIEPTGRYRVLADGLIDKTEGYDKHSDVILGVGKDSDGNIYVADTGGKRIVKISPEGEKSDFYVSNENWNPTGITFYNGGAYILEFTEKLDGPRITYLKEDRKEVYFDYDRYKEGSFIFPLLEGNGPNYPLFYSVMVALLMFTVVLVYAKYRFMFRKG